MSEEYLAYPTANDGPAKQVTGAAPAQLPPKIVGKHRWVMAVAYTLTTDEAASIYDPDHPNFGEWSAVPDDITSWGVGCIDCEIGFTDAMKTASLMICPARGVD